MIEVDSTISKRGNALVKITGSCPKDEINSLVYLKAVDTYPVITPKPFIPVLVPDYQRLTGKLSVTNRIDTTIVVWPLKPGD